MFGWLRNLYYGKRPPANANGDGFLEVNAKTGKMTPVEDTSQGKLWKQIATNHCPDCGHEGFYEGPEGGISINIKCTNEECGHKFNVTPLIGIAERI